LRIAGKGGNRANIGGSGKCNQVGDGIAPDSQGQVQQEGCEHQADGIIEKQCTQYTHQQDFQGKETARIASQSQEGVSCQSEKTCQPKVGIDNHHAEQ